MFVYRVQNNEGRGPFQPGITDRWIDLNNPYDPPSIIDEFGLEWRNEIPKNWHAGTACRTKEKLFQWFNVYELHAMKDLGFNPVKLKIYIIIRESEHQLIFMRKVPHTHRAVTIDIPIYL